jgi:hypothetical protein
MKKLYKIKVTQTLVFEDYIEAESLSEADSKKDKAWCDEDTHVQKLSSDSRSVFPATGDEKAKHYGDSTNH